MGTSPSRIPVHAYMICWPTAQLTDTFSTLYTASALPHHSVVKKLCLQSVHLHESSRCQKCKSLYYSHDKRCSAGIGHLGVNDPFHTLCFWSLWRAVDARCRLRHASPLSTAFRNALLHLIYATTPFFTYTLSQPIMSEGRSSFAPPSHPPNNDGEARPLPEGMFGFRFMQIQD